MRAAVFKGAGVVHLEDVPEPTVETADDVVIEVEACGICGTDLQILNVPPGHPATLGVVMGHEFVGRVSAVGSTTSGVAVGQRVTVDPELKCGSCRNCRAGRPASCEAVRSLGIFGDGALARYVKAPAAAVFPISDGPPSAVAALIEPLACVVNGVNKGNPRPGESAIIFGAGTIGCLFLAMFMRIGLLFVLSWIVGLTAPLFSVLGDEFSGRDLILILGGLFLIAKATHEIHQKLEGETGHASTQGAAASFGSVIAQIVALDAIFSLDSVITAVGMVREIPIMVLAIVLAVLFMMWFARPLGDFVERHPTVKMLALSFLLLIGLSLIADGLGQHIPKGYIYFAMGFSVFVEMLNIRLKRVGKPVKLHDDYRPGEGK